MWNCDIKFVNKEITPFGGLSMFFKMLEKCHFEEHVMQSGVPFQGSPWLQTNLADIGIVCRCVVWRKLLWSSWRGALWRCTMWPIRVETRSRPSCIPALSQRILPSCQPACFRKFVPLVFLRVEVRQLHFRLRFYSDGPRGKSGAAKGYNSKRPGDSRIILSLHSFPM